MAIVYRQTIKEHRWLLRKIKAKWLLGGLVIFLFIGFLIGGYCQSSLYKKEIEQIKNKNSALREEVGRLTGMIPSDPKKKGH